MSTVTSRSVRSVEPCWRGVRLFPHADGRARLDVSPNWRILGSYAPGPSPLRSSRRCCAALIFSSARCFCCVGVSSFRGVRPERGVDPLPFIVWLSALCSGRTPGRFTSRVVRNDFWHASAMRYSDTCRDPAPITGHSTLGLVSISLVSLSGEQSRIQKRFSRLHLLLLLVLECLG